MLNMSEPRDFAVQTHYASTWSHAKFVLSDFGRGWIFRGQQRSDWSLTTAIERLRVNISAAAAESRMLREFQRRAHHYAEAATLPEQTLDVLALMQHYGAPTRLLDCTRSPYVAAYFALESLEGEYDTAAIWCINENWCLDRARECLRATEPETKTLPLFFEFSSEQIFDKFLIGGGCRIAVPVEPFRLHQRMTAQQGLFLCPGDLNTPLMDNLASMYDGKSPIEHPVQKIELQAGARVDALEDLNRMNINRATLFPGIEGLARSLALGLVGVKETPWEKVIREGAKEPARVVPPDVSAIQWSER